MALDGEMKRKKAMGELVSHERGTIRLMDFWSEVWWPQYAVVHLTPRTQDNYERLWRRHILPTLGRSRMRDISRQDVVRLTSQLSGKLAPSSTRKVLAVLQCVLARAVDWSYIATNPAQGAKRPKLVTREGRALDHEQIAALLLELDLRSKMIVQVLTGSGLRPGELRALRWCDVSVAALWIIVDKAVSSDVVGPTKTLAKRQVDLRDPVASALAEWQFATGERYSGRALIFPAVDGSGLWTDAGWRMWQRQVFNPAAARAGLKGVVPYDLRHTFASTLIAEGRDIYWIARQLGHSPMMTLTTYGHLFRDSRCTPGVLPSAVRLES